MCKCEVGVRASTGLLESVHDLSPLFAQTRRFGVGKRLADLALRSMAGPMFTGIVAGRFRVVEAIHELGKLELWVDLQAHASGIQVGASVAVDGVCLTAVACRDGAVRFQVITETLERTTLGRLVGGSIVNVERSYRVGDEIGGHEVAGHVIGMGEVSQLLVLPGETAIEVRVPKEWMKYILSKGFIAIDGASLTVGETRRDGALWLHLIPETLARTTLGLKDVGSQVNVELDARTVALVDTVERVLDERLANLDIRARVEP